MSETAEKKTWRVLELINWTTDYLKGKGFTSARSDVEWLLTDVLDCSRMELYTEFEKPLKQFELDAFKKLLKRRVNHEPVQYIIGETEFMGFPFKVDKSVLIPRPETEILVERAADWLRSRAENARTVLDVGIGSGCIGVSLARLVPNSQVTAVDVSGDALNLAGKNAEINGVSAQITFWQLDILSEAPKETYDMIVSNPPYIAEDEAETLQEDIHKFEPHEALIAEDDGLTFYRRFALAAREWLTSDGRLMLEIGGSHQSEAVRKLFKERGWAQITVHKDYNQQDRIIIVEK